jgi:hypothetical protein
MAMKRVIWFILSLVFLTSACSGMEQGAAQLAGLPDDAQVLIFSLITAGVTWLLLKASEFFKIDLSGYANAAAAAIAPILIAIIESWLGLIPPVFDNLVLSIIHLIVLLIGSLGAFFLFKRKAPSLR